MSRTFYSEYAQHCMRFYARHPNPKFQGNADRENWLACQRALNEFSQEDRVRLLTIFKGGDTIADNVFTMSQDEGIDQNRIWHLISELERKVAKKRGLL